MPVLQWFIAKAHGARSPWILEVQPPPTSLEYMRAKRSGEASYSEFINSGKWSGYTPPPLPGR